MYTSLHTYVSNILHMSVEQVMITVKTTLCVEVLVFNPCFHAYNYLTLYSRR